MTLVYFKMIILQENWSGLQVINLTLAEWIATKYNENIIKLEYKTLPDKRSLNVHAVWWT